MTSPTQSIRQHIESLVLGQYGSGRTMDTRFRLHVDGTPMQHEREINVLVPENARAVFEGYVNPRDAYRDVSRDVTVVIHYLRTQGGYDLAENVSGYASDQTDDGVDDRAGADVADIKTVLEYDENWQIPSVSDPAVHLITALQEQPEFERDNDRATVRVRFRVDCRESTTSTLKAP